MTYKQWLILGLGQPRAQDALDSGLTLDQLEDVLVSDLAASAAAWRCLRFPVCFSSTNCLVL